MSDRYQLQRSIAYAEAVKMYAQNHPTARYLCHVTPANTPLSTLWEGEGDAAAAAIPSWR